MFELNPIFTFFSLSFPMKKGQLLDEPCGTSQFLAPEMILGRYGRYSPREWVTSEVAYVVCIGRLIFGLLVYCAICYYLDAAHSNQIPKLIYSEKLLNQVDSKRKCL